MKHSRISQKCSSRSKSSNCWGRSTQLPLFSCSTDHLVITCALWARALLRWENWLLSGRQGLHGWMLSLDEPFIHRTNMITQNGFEFIGIYLGLWGVQWASTMPGKHTPRCKGAAKTVHSGKQQALEPVHIYWSVPHTVLVTLLSTSGWLMTQDCVDFSHHLQKCMWGVIKGLCSETQFPPLFTDDDCMSQASI